jgi:hypothetical protein
MRRLQLALPFAFALVGCASRPLYQRVNFSEPNPFTRPGCKLAVEDVRVDHLMVEGKPEAEWLAAKTPQQQASHQEDKRRGQEKFSKELRKRRAPLLAAAGASGENVFVLRTTFVDWDPGSYSGRFGLAHITFDVVDAAGKALDQFTFEGRVLGYSTGDRLMAEYISAAWAIDQYLGDRWSCTAQ